MDVSVYIRELLFGHDCVIIPGFGAFIGNYSPATINREEGVFYPPSRKITFNRHLISNDGLLIGHISSRTGVGYAGARDMVTSYCDDLRRRLSEKESVFLEHLGLFSLNREGTVIFEPDKDANYLLTSFGLENYHRQPVTDYDIRKRVLEQHHKNVNVNQPSIRRLLTRAAVIIPLLVAMALVPFNKEIFKGRPAETSMNPLAKAELEYNRSQITNVTPPVTGEIVLTAPAVVGEESVNSEVEIITDVEVIKYTVITGSFRTESNALTMVEALRNKGYDPEITAGPDGFLRVSAATYEELAEAEGALKNLAGDYPGSWVCKLR